MRGHLALLLGLSANSPFWQGRDSGLASARTPIFGAFPRVGIPSRFADYEEYVDRVDVLLRAGAFPEATFLWWDVRPQPRFGTVEVRVMDVQTRCAATSALAALVQSIARLELEEGYLDDASLDHPELLAENRFIASRDGIRAELIDPTHGTKVPLRRLLDDLLHAARPHADALGCRDSLESVNALVQENGAAEQLRLARQHNGDLAAIVSELAMSFCT
jgi:carboxylate-amine ligase